MPTPDTSGIPPWADFEDLKNKMNELVAKYNNLLVNLDSLNVVSLTADHIDAGTIDANKVTIRDDLASGAFIQIDGNGLVVNNGSYNTLTADINGHITATSATIQSATGYPRVVLDPAGNLFGAYLDANNYIEIQPNYGGSPSLNFFQGGVLKGRINTLLGNLEVYGSAGIELNGGGTTGTVRLDGNATFDSFSKMKTISPATDLQTALNAKANGSGISGTVYVSSSSSSFVAQAITFTNGVRTS